MRVAAITLSPFTPLLAHVMMKSVMQMAYSEQQWQEAKRRCRLSDEDIQLARRLGLNPRSLIKNIPSKFEPWKAPVSEWLDAKRRKKAEHKSRRKEKAAE